MMTAMVNGGKKRFATASGTSSILNENIASMKSKPSLLLQRQSSAHDSEDQSLKIEYTPELTLENKSAILRS
jgi:hypothetical protein